MGYEIELPSNGDEVIIHYELRDNPYVMDTHKKVVIEIERVN